MQIFRQKWIEDGRNCWFAVISKEEDNVRMTGGRFWKDIEQITGIVWDGILMVLVFFSQVYYDRWYRMNFGELGE